MKRIYLAGPINGCTDAQCNDWREEAIKLLGDQFEIANPMRRDYRGREMIESPQIVYNDLRDIDSCHVLLANVQAPSWGTAMEVYHAFTSRKLLVVLWIGLTHPSPWLRMHGHCLAPHLNEAVSFIKLGMELPPPCPKCGFSRCTTGEYVCRPKGEAG